jgi:hypothetical protein
MKLIEILPTNPMASLPKFKIRLHALRLGRWCIGLSRDYKGLTYIGVWRYDPKPEIYGQDAL